MLQVGVEFSFEADAGLCSLFTLTLVTSHTHFKAVQSYTTPMVYCEVDALHAVDMSYLFKLDESNSA